MNEPETIRRKLRNNMGLKPLIETGELRSSFFYRVAGTNKVIISIRSGRKKIGAHLQSGIKTRHGMKQYKFFGISPDAYDELRNYLKNRIAEVTRAKRRK